MHLETLYIITLYTLVIYRGISNNTVEPLFFNSTWWAACCSLDIISNVLFYFTQTFFKTTKTPACLSIYRNNTTSSHKPCLFFTDGLVHCTIPNIKNQKSHIIATVLFIIITSSIIWDLAKHHYRQILMVIIIWLSITLLQFYSDCMGSWVMSFSNFKKLLLLNMNFWYAVQHQREFFVLLVS